MAARVGAALHHPLAGCVVARVAGCWWLAPAPPEAAALRDLAAGQRQRPHGPAVKAAPHRDDASPGLVTLHRERYSGRKGAVVQVFRINERGDGLGRISDARVGPSGSRHGSSSCEARIMPSPYRVE